MWVLWFSCIVADAVVGLVCHEVMKMEIKQHWGDTKWES